MTPHAFAFERVPEVGGERVLLRELSASDAKDVFAFSSDPEVQRYNAKPHENLRETLAAIAEDRRSYERKQLIMWGVQLRDSGRVIGSVCIFDWNPYHRVANLGYAFAKDCWGRGLASDALRALIDFAFRRLELNRLEATTLVVNLRSVALLERLGFQREGTRRQRMLDNDGAFQDSALFGLLSSEWRSSSSPP
jgi:ribosomal-protein-alanine N-acetyltransferase